MARLNQQYYADNVSLKKDGKEFSLNEEFLSKLEEFPDVVDNVTSSSSTDALSANMGRHLQDQIDQLASVGTFLSLWDCTTGLPTTNPTTNPYQYKTGNYYIVDKIADAGETNYRPKGSQYNAGVASTDEEIEDVKVGDWYLYDGTQWIRQPNSGKEIPVDDALSLTSRNPVENRVVTEALNNKQDTIDDLADIRDGAEKGATAIQPGDNISELENNVGYQTEGDVEAKLTGYYTKDEIDEKENGYVKFGDNSPDNIYISAYDENGNGFELYPNSFYVENEDGDVEEYDFFGDYRIAKLNETMRGFPVPERGDDISNILEILKRNKPVYFYEKRGESYNIWVVQSFVSQVIKSYMNNKGDYLDVWVNDNGWECDGHSVANADLVYQQSYTWHILPSNNTWDGVRFSQYRETSSSFTVNGDGLFRMGFEYKLKVKNTGQSTITVTLGNKLLNPRNIPTTVAKGKTVIFLFYSSHNTMSTMELSQRIERPIGEDMSNYYNKSEVDSLLEDKADSSDLDSKADKSELPDMSNYYNKTETDDLLDAKVDANDVNTKTFYLSNTSDTTTAQAIYDWYNNGKNPIVAYGIGNSTFILYDTNGFQPSEPLQTLLFRSSYITEYNNQSAGYSQIALEFLRIKYDSNIDQYTITLEQIPMDNKNSYLSTNKNYTTPYTPQYDGSPATKKYVDDAIAGVENNVKIFTLSDTSDLVNAQAAYDWCANGNNPIIKYGSSYYTLHIQTATYMQFVRIRTRDNPSGTVATRMQMDTVNLSISNSSVTAIAKYVNQINISSSAPSSVNNNIITLVV